MAGLSAMKEPPNVNTLEDLLKPEFSHLRVWFPNRWTPVVYNMLKDQASVPEFQRAF